MNVRYEGGRVFLESDNGHRIETTSEELIKVLHAVQDHYANEQITITWPRFRWETVAYALSHECDYYKQADLIYKALETTKQEVPADV